MYIMNVRKWYAVTTKMKNDHSNSPLVLNMFALKHKANYYKMSVFPKTFIMLQTIKLYYYDIFTTLANAKP